MRSGLVVRTAAVGLREDVMEGRSLSATIKAKLWREGGLWGWMGSGDWKCCWITAAIIGCRWAVAMTTKLSLRRCRHCISTLVSLRSQSDHALYRQVYRNAANNSIVADTIGYIWVYCYHFHHSVCKRSVHSIRCLIVKYYILVQRALKL